jgi:hypothetical protein
MSEKRWGVFIFEPDGRFIIGGVSDDQGKRELFAWRMRWVNKRRKPRVAVTCDGLTGAVKVSRCG